MRSKWVLPWLAFGLVLVPFVAYPNEEVLRLGKDPGQ